jgi:hypothetical protein
VPVAADFDALDLAEASRLDDFVAGLDEVGRAAPLGVDLDDAVVLAGRGDHGLAFDDIDGRRFLAVDIHARLHGLDRWRACQWSGVETIITSTSFSAIILR